MPQSETDRWAVAAAFATTVSGAVIAALSVWATDRGVNVSMKNTVDFEDGEPVHASPLPAKSSASLLNGEAVASGTFRISALTVGAIANFIVLANLMAGVEGSLPITSVVAIAVALAVIAMYLAHIAGVLLHRGMRAAGTICVCLWVMMACGIALSHLSVAQQNSYSQVAGLVLEAPDSFIATLPSTIVLLILYVATGVSVMIGPYVKLRR